MSTSRSVYLFPSVFILIPLSSINHEYKEWDDKNPQVTTCNKDTKKLIQGSTVPQEVDSGKRIVFSYDVSFKVFLTI